MVAAQIRRTHSSGLPLWWFRALPHSKASLRIANGSKLVNIRPSASLADDRCVSVDTVGTLGFPANVVASGAQSFAAGSDGNVRSFARQSGIWLDNAAWGGGTGSTVVSNRPIQGLALSTRLLGTTRLRGVFELDRGTGNLLGSYPDGGLSSDPGGPVQLNSQLVFGGCVYAERVRALRRGQPYSGLQIRVSIPAAAASTPLAGAGGKLYLATVSGSLLCRTLAEASWSGLLGPAESPFSARLRSAARRERSGAGPFCGWVLYVGSADWESLRDCRRQSPGSITPHPGPSTSTTSGTRATRRHRSSPAPEAPITGVSVERLSSRHYQAQVTFHEGELLVQDRAGVRGEARRVAQMLRVVIRPDARLWLAQRPFVVVAAETAAGTVWVSILAGPPGFRPRFRRWDAARRDCPPGAAD